MHRIVLSSDKHGRIRNGHPWIYHNEVATLPDDLMPGELVEVIDGNDRFIGRGYANPRSKIVVRLLTRAARTAIDASFFHAQVLQAWRLRERLGLTRNCRVVFGEADGLPGLIVDKFDDAMVLQAHTAGIARWQDEIVAALGELFTSRLIVARNDLPVRDLEGLPQHKGVVYGSGTPRVTIEEHGLRFTIDLLAGQKTGFFLDQRNTWHLLEPIARGAQVLDCFCYIGAFGLHAARCGAAAVTGIDASDDAITWARANAEENGLADRCEFLAGNVFDLLTDWAKTRARTFDVIILDPPAFTKTRGTTESALRGYKEINRRALQLLNPGGFLLSCSCSRFVTPEMLATIIADAAHDVARPLRQIGYATQAPDHPIDWAIPETFYLKSFLLTAT